jgi:hypothetical protein
MIDFKTPNISQESLLAKSPKSPVGKQAQDNAVSEGVRVDLSFLTIYLSAMVRWK